MLTMSYVLATARLARPRQPFAPKLRHFSSEALQRQKATKLDFDHCIDLVQNRDRESYLCGLLMPYKSRQSYFAIRAFNAELASVKDSATRKHSASQFNEAGASLALKVRVQWWRNAIGLVYGDTPATEETQTDKILATIADPAWNNPVVRVMDHAVQESNLTRRFLERLVEAREEDLDISQTKTMKDAIAYSESTISSLLYLSLETTDVRDEASDLVAFHAGIGIGLATALRGARIRFVRGECPLPQELFPEEFPYHKLCTTDPKHDLSNDEREAIREAVKHMAAIASSHLSKAKDLQGDVPRHARPCLLPVVPALHYLSKLDKLDYDIFDDALLEQDQLTVLGLLGRTWLTGVF